MLRGNPLSLLQRVRRWFLLRRLARVFEKALKRRPARLCAKDVTFLLYVQDSVELGPRGPGATEFWLAVWEQVGAAVERRVSEGAVGEARRMILPRLLGAFEAEAELRVLARVALPRPVEGRN